MPNFVILSFFRNRPNLLKGQMITIEIGQITEIAQISEISLETFQYFETFETFLNEIKTFDAEGHLRVFLLFVRNCAYIHKHTHYARS